MSMVISNHMWYDYMQWSYLISQFEYKLFNNISSVIEFHHMRTTSYHTQSNDIIEILHRTWYEKVIIQNWFITFSIVMLGYRMSPNYNGYDGFF